ncbi:MAG TPA: trehalase-like domain-containing protein, partial [Myxococcales bacterium]|nr:trehalase-like domain-containing protein [Myxococcales bacterium]
MSASIRDYAIVGDCRSAALISRGGSLDWLCWPQFDSPSLFAAILDEERGGRFVIAPAGDFRSERRYLGETSVLRTTFHAAEGELSLTDFMPVLTREDARRRMHPEHELQRIVRCERGEVEVEILFDPRPDYARKRPALRRMGRLGLRAEVPGGLLTLCSEAPLPPEGRARVRL